MPPFAYDANSSSAEIMRRRKPGSEGVPAGYWRTPGNRGATGCRTGPRSKLQLQPLNCRQGVKGLWPGKVVTEVSEAGPFWEAEPEHQDYLQRIPNGYTCHFVRPGWKLPVRQGATTGAGR